jgi:hypothetical protein
MALTVRYQPPNAVAMLAEVAAAKIVAENAAAEALLKAALPLVPIDIGELYASGDLERRDGHAVVVFHAVAEDGYDYAVIQHEDLTYAHEHGQAKYLEQPLHTEAHALVEGMARVMRRVIG